MIPNALNVTIGEDVEVQTAAEAPTRTFKIDFDAGRVGGFCDETEAMKQAIYKILQTERFEYLIYSWNYGIELNAVVGKSFQVFASEIKRVFAKPFWQTAGSPTSQTSKWPRLTKEPLP